MTPSYVVLTSHFLLTRNWGQLKEQMGASPKALLRLKMPTEKEVRCPPCSALQTLYISMQLTWEFLTRSFFLFVCLFLPFLYLLPLWQEAFFFFFGHQDNCNLTERAVPTSAKPDGHVCAIILLVLCALSTDAESEQIMIASNSQYFCAKSGSAHLTLITLKNSLGFLLLLLHLLPQCNELGLGLPGVAGGGGGAFLLYSRNNTMAEWSWVTDTLC